MTHTEIEQLHFAIDAMNADAFCARLTPDALFRFGNHPPVVGQAAIHGAVTAFWASIGGSRHHLVRFWQDGDDVAVQGEVTYTRKDGGRLTLPFVNVFRLRDGRICEYRIHIDNTPLYA
jgi:ketosteroid isomerase-like protein